MDELQETIEEILETVSEAAPAIATVGLIGTAGMVLPMAFTPSATSVFSGSTPTSFNGPQPGQAGGGSLPMANTPNAAQARNVFQSLQNGEITGISAIGIGALVAVFELPRTPENFGATALIFEEKNSQRPQRMKRGIRSQIISFAKFLLFISQTIEKGQSKLAR